MEHAKKAAVHFGIEVSCHCEAFGNGHINDTFLVDGKYILQRINTQIFADVEQLMENIEAVTAHLRRRVETAGGDPARQVLQYVLADTGKPYYTDTDGRTYRMCRYIADSFSPDTVEIAADMYAAGTAFGRFQKQLAGFDASRLTESIPDFHNTLKRWDAFLQSVQKNAAGRRDTAQEEVAFLQSRAALMREILTRYADLPLRVTHNDAKLSNVLLDRQTRTPLCVIDLDTVMPGYAANDFGDAIRTGASTAAEDEPDLTKVHLDMEMYAAFAKGFLEECGEILTAEEIDSLPYGCMLMTFEQALRFLTDYLDGDRYYKTHREAHNLDRTRTQIQLLREMEASIEPMQQIVQQYR